MSQSKDTGLAAIAQSTRKTSATKTTPENFLEAAKPPLVLEGRCNKTSVSLDIGLWNCVFELAHAMTMRLRAKRQGRVTPVDILEAAFTKFYELPLDEQFELVRRHRER